jgi:hypothetical protein
VDVLSVPHRYSFPSGLALMEPNWWYAFCNLFTPSILVQWVRKCFVLDKMLLISYMQKVPGWSRTCTIGSVVQSLRLQNGTRGHRERKHAEFDSFSEENARV